MEPTWQNEAVDTNGAMIDSLIILQLYLNGAIRVM